MTLGDSSQAHLVTRHISHSANMKAQYYQAIVSDRHAVSVYGTMTMLRDEDGGRRGNSGSQAGPITISIQRCWSYSAKETNEISVYFSGHIEKGMMRVAGSSLRKQGAAPRRPALGRALLRHCHENGVPAKTTVTSQKSMFGVNFEHCISWRAH